jgi:glycerol-3-phosphate dehydrogenase
MGQEIGRAEIWESLQNQWDLVVVGGGITGAGILREACRLGLKALLLEQRDFAWGTSSRSSKLVHGGFRYLMQGRFALTRACVRERNRLLREGAGLINPLSFLLAIDQEGVSTRWAFEAGLCLYDLLSGKWAHRTLSPPDLLRMSPGFRPRGLKGGFLYGDAQTDDARLVLRVIREAVNAGGTALNYAPVEEVLYHSGRAVGVRVRDEFRNQTVEVFCKVVINATGPRADSLRGKFGRGMKIRPLRGSHLILSSDRLPLVHAVTFRHPSDRKRYVFALPWEGATLVGTTDLDHGTPPQEEPAITTGEMDYLMTAVQEGFPSAGLSLEDVLSTFAGVRPVVGTGKVDPSRESREYVILREKGLITVMGGKLTTFRLVARDALRAARTSFPLFPLPGAKGPILKSPGENLLGGGDAPLPRIQGRHGEDASEMANSAEAGDREIIPGTPCLWGELRWAARREAVVHLEDLLLRRVRIGLLLPSGGVSCLSRVRTICQKELKWDDARWEKEKAEYLALYRRCYSLPGPF